MIFQNAIWSFRNDDENNQAIIAKLLEDRGITTDEQVQAFLYPKIEDLKDPFLLADMHKAVNRIEEAIHANEKIWIYGDYDVDGITSIAILCKYFSYRGLEPAFYIPDRQDEGYGINIQGLESIKASGGTLVITVDCGITALEQAAYAKSMGLDLIITDHHEFQDQLPDALAVINPKRGDYPFKALAGCGVALKLVQALAGEDFNNFYQEVIDIAALGTVADIVPLIDENRVITSIGLKRMMETSNPGIQALIAEAGLVGKEINAGHIGFVIAPRINASGRIGNPSIAVDMLLEKDYYMALETAKKLSALNTERQAQEREIMLSAERYIQENIDFELDKIMLVIGDDWHTGIIGIVASKLSDKYARPTVILNNDGIMAKGSARSIDGISIYEVLSHSKALFEKFGGHDQAAGLSLKSENISALRAALRNYGKAHIKKYMLIKKEKVSGQLTPQMVNHQLVEDLEALKPFGMGNPKPQFVFGDLAVEDYKVMGKLQNHLKIIVNDGNRVYDALAFNRSEFAKYIKRNDKIHLLIHLEKNTFLGIETIQFMIRDMVKDRMPFSELMLHRIHLSLFNFIHQSKGLPRNDKFTSLNSFDIIITVPREKPLYIFSLEGLTAFKDKVLKENFVSYTMHFNVLDPFEQRVGYLDVVFMPTEEMENGNLAYLGASTKMELLSYIPDRQDLTNIYKQINGKVVYPLSELANALQMLPAKVRMGLEILKEMALVNVKENYGYFKFEWLTKPSEKIDLESLLYYQKLIRTWRD